MTREQKEFLQLYEPVHDRFERFCRARVYGQMDFRDLMNDVLVVAFQKYTTLKSEESFLSFLFGISIRLLANNYKKRKPDYVDLNELQHISAEEETDMDTEVHLLYQCLARLPEEQKESLVLFEISGFSTREIAQFQKCSESSVRQRLVRGRQKLRQLMNTSSSKPQNLKPYE